MFDMEILVPVCGRFRRRIDDFKRYGLVNLGGRSVLLNLVVSNEKIDGLESGWPEGVEAKVLNSESSNHVANLYRFYTQLDPSAPRARWLVRLDDDSCTDVDGLLSNLDKFYGSDMPFYLGDLNRFHAARGGGEHVPLEHYRSLLKDFEPFLDLMQNEVECGIMSAAAVSRVLGDDGARGLLHKRASLDGGFGDCVVALASAMAGVWPVDCPFVTHRPLIHEFSLFGGIRNHIHQVSRVAEGENFWDRSSPECFMLLTKRIDDDPNEMERSIVGRRFLVEAPNFIRIVEFKEDYIARIKLEHRQLNWYESKGEVLLFLADEILHRFKVLEDGTLSCEGFSVKEI